jgi:hypothetical protein
VARDDVKFQSAKKRGESGAAAESDDANATRGRNLLPDDFFHESARARAGDFTLAENCNDDEERTGSGENDASGIYRTTMQYQ